MKHRNSTRAGWLMTLLSAAALAGCSSGGGDDGPGEPPPSPPPPPPPNAGTVALALAGTSADEDAGGLTFTVSRSGGSDGVVEVEVRIAGGTADPVDDVSLVGNVLEFADGDDDAKTGELLITDDSEDEADETVELELVVVSGGATLGTATAALTIADNDDPPPPPPAEPGYGLNDTGVTLCVDGGGVEFDCAAPEVSDYPGQDATGGRDVSEPADADGRAGFVFSRLDATGAALTDPAPDYATTPWVCVMDHVTGLIWEVKTRDGGLHDADSTFFWRRPRIGEPPSETGPAACSQPVDCGVRDYVSAVNAAGLCGLNNWRVPRRHELLSIVDFGSRTTAAIDEVFFPNTVPAPFWTSSRTAVTDAVKFVEFDEGISTGAVPSTAFRIRLVSGGY